MRLRVEQLVVDYPGVRAVDGVDLAVGDGRVLALVGPNGCGKSTLLRSIARLQRPTAGRVLVDDEPVWSMQPRRAAQRIALLPQSPQAPDALTVAGLIRYGRHPHQGLLRQWSSADERAVDAALTATDLHALAGRRLEQLSGGQRQRAWLAMALAQEAPLMLLDEPTSMLDLGHQIEVLELVRSLAAAGRTLVLVLHDLIAAARYADDLVAMRDGRVVAAGAACDIVTPALVYELYGIEADVWHTANDRAPVVVPRRRGPTEARPRTTSPDAQRWSRGPRAGSAPRSLGC